MTTRAQKITNSIRSEANSKKYSDFPMGFEVHPDTGDLFRFTNENAVKKSLRNLIFTDKYERVFRPDVGCNVRALLFSNMTPESLIAIKDTIRDTIDKYEPRVAIQEIQVVAQPDQNGVVINIIFQILNISQTQFLSITIDRAR